MLSIDCKKISEEISLFLKEEFEKRNKKRAILAISGGIDSALVAFLCKRAELDLYGIILPYNGKGSDGIKIAEELNLPNDHVITIDIAPLVNVAEKEIEKFVKLDQFGKGNIMARQRMIIQYALAKHYDALVVGTENLSEYYLGYFTLHGDQACDISPISGLWKTQVREMSRYLNLPNWVIERAPSAGLWEDQTDEKEFGFTYKDADEILYLSQVLNYSKEKITLEYNFNTDLIDKVFKRVEATAFKREEPPKPIK